MHLGLSVPTELGDGERGVEILWCQPHPPPPTTLISRCFLLYCNHRTCSETLNNTVQGWSLCLTSVMSSCTTLMPVPMRQSATPSSRPPEAWTDAGGTSVPCQWSGEWSKAWAAPKCPKCARPHSLHPSVHFEGSWRRGLSRCDQFLLKKLFKKTIIGGISFPSSPAPRAVTIAGLLSPQHKVVEEVLSPVS